MEIEFVECIFIGVILAIAAAGTTGSETTSPRDAEALPFLFSGMIMTQ